MFPTPDSNSMFVWSWNEFAFSINISIWSCERLKDGERSFRCALLCGLAHTTYPLMKEVQTHTEWWYYILDFHLRQKIKTDSLVFLLLIPISQPAPCLHTMSKPWLVLVLIKISQLSVLCRCFHVAAGANSFWKQNSLIYCDKHQLLRSAVVRQQKVDFLEKGTFWTD